MRGNEAYFCVIFTEYDYSEYLYIGSKAHCCLEVWWVCKARKRYRLTAIEDKNEYERAYLPSSVHSKKKVIHPRTPARDSIKRQAPSPTPSTHIIPSLPNAVSIQRVCRFPEPLELDLAICQQRLKSDNQRGDGMCRNSICGASTQNVLSGSNSVIAVVAGSCGL